MIQQINTAVPKNLANKLGDKRFMAVDPVKGNVRNPQSMVQYTYVLNNPLLYVDPLGELAQNYFHDQVVRDIIANYSSTNGNLVSERRVYKDTKWVKHIYNGRVDLVDLKTGEVWDVKPISYNKGYNYKQKAMPQMQRYYASYLCPEHNLKLHAGADFKFAGSFKRQVNNKVYKVDYSTRPSVDRVVSTQPDGLIIYTQTVIEEIPIQEYAYEELSELGENVINGLKVGARVVINGVVYIVVAVGTIIKLVKVVAPL